MKLLLIRHAEAKRGAAVDGRSPDYGLTELGKEQAASLASSVGWNEEWNSRSQLLCSPLPRAVETAKILADLLGLPKFQQEDSLSEMGEAPGPHDHAEDWLAFLGRVDSTMMRFAGLYFGQRVMAVTHAGFIMASVRVLLEVPAPSVRARLDPRNACITEWTFDGAVWRLEQYNSASSS
jgi:broad specificity phosphatase PhoE